MLAAVCFVIALAPRDSIDGKDVTILWPPWQREALEWVVQLHWILGVLIVMPFLISWVVASNLRVLRPQGHDPALDVFNPSMTSPPPHASEDQALWKKRRLAIKTSWGYEWARIQRLQCRLGLQALIFGDMATLALAGAVLLPQSLPGNALALRIACSAAAAVATAFFANLVRVMLRISSGDVTTRTFAWATRSLTLVIIADVGLCLILGDAVPDSTRAPLLGVFVGATGDHAIQFLIDRAAKMFNTGTTDAWRSSPLLEIEGITAAHVERLEEEGIASIHDLAFAPTARLFFATAYSLQQICNWQDRALLQVYVGKRAAEALSETMSIRGAIDLRAFAHNILFEGGHANAAQIRESLRKALNLDEGGFAALLESMAHDEVAMRLRYYWGSVVGESRPGEVEPPRGKAAVHGNGSAPEAAPAPTNDAHNDAVTCLPSCDDVGVEAHASREALDTHGGNGHPRT